MRVMLVYPNDRQDALISTGISVLSAHLKDAGHEVRLYDTTFIDDGKETGDSFREGMGQVIKVDLKKHGVRRVPMSREALGEDFRQAVRDYDPGIVGFSTLEITYDQGLRLANALNEMENRPPVIFGGIYPTFAPRIVLKEPSIDMICEGEGEIMFPELVTALERGEDIRPILNLTVKHEDGQIYRSGRVVSLEDLATGDDFKGEKTGLRRPQTHMGNELLTPDLTIYDDKRFWKKMGGKAVRTVAMELSRGCPYTCTFCCVPMQQQQHKVARSKFRDLLIKQGNRGKPPKDTYHREKPIGKFIKELVEARDRWGLDFVYFTDESFLSMSPRRFDEFIKAYREVKLPFFIETRVETVRDGYAKALEEVGCVAVAMGVESGDMETRKRLLERTMTDDMIVRGFKAFENTSIRISANNIIGFPGESREDIMRTIDINRAINPDSIVVNAFRPYSGTKLRQVCIDQGLIPPLERAEDNRVYGAFYNGVLPAKELEGIRRAFPLYVKFPKSRWMQIRIAEFSDQVYDSLQREFQEQGMLYREQRARADGITAEEIFIHD